jgi:hypothetical protein
MSGKFNALVALLLGKEALIPFEQEVGWAPEPVWMFWKREKSLTPARILTLDHPACSLVTILAALS